MNKSRVCFAPVKPRDKEGLLHRLERLCGVAGVDGCVRKGDLSAIKLHFGEPGNTAFISPVFARKIVEKILSLGARPFLTDTTTLYPGPRANSVDHILSACANGFSLETTGAPVVIADGLRGESVRSVPVPGPLLQEVEIAEEILQADSMIVLAHFTGHEVSGFGGVMKSLAMGCCSQGAKLRMHSVVSPRVNPDRCTGCGLCRRWCRFGAIELKSAKARVLEDACTGCGECVGVCPERAVRIRWETSRDFHRLLVEHALGSLHGKEGRCLFFNFLIQVTPACDCYPFSDPPIVPDLGILVSSDPVAVDRAALDLVDQTAGLPNTRLGARTKAHTKKFRVLYPDVKYEEQFQHAEAVGLGRSDYELVTV